MNSIRHFLLSIVVALASILTAQAQSFEFRYDGEPLEDGATVELQSMRGIFGEIECNSARLLLYNLTSSPITCTGTIVVTSNNMVASTKICMSGQCVDFTGSNSFSFTTAANGTQATLFEAYPTQEGTLDATLTITCGSEKRTVYIHCVHGDVSGIDGVTISGDATADVYNLSGRLLRGGVSGHQLSSLPRGVYMVTYRQPGKVAVTRKYVVR